MPYGSKKNADRVATGSAGGTKKSSNAAANLIAKVLNVAQMTGQVPANESVAMTSGAAHGRESPNSTDGGLAASQTNPQAASSNARQMPFNTSCDRALPIAAMPRSSMSVASQSPANAGGRGTRRDAAAAAAAALATQRSVTQQVAFNAGCSPATIASLGNNGAGCSSMEAFAGAQNASPSRRLLSEDSEAELNARSASATACSVSGASGSGSSASIGMQNVVSLPVRIDADSGAVGSSTVEAVLPSELLSGAGRRRSRQDLQPEQEAEETEEIKRARLFGRTALDAEDYLRHAESVAGLIISINASYWSFMDAGSVVVPDHSRYHGKVHMHTLCYNLSSIYPLSNKGYLKRSTWTVGRPPSYTVPLTYISTQLK